MTAQTGRSRPLKPQADRYLPDRREPMRIDPAAWRRFQNGVGPRLGHGLLALALSAPWALSPSAGALDLQGRTEFVRAPWRADLVSDDSTAGAAPVKYYLTLQLDPQAGASLGRIRLQQIRGADRQFGFSPERSRAFVGRPRREGATRAVQVVFEPAERSLTATFSEPVAPGETVTLVLRPWTNPTVADTYQFAVVIWPAGPDPQPRPVGIATLRIYERWTR